MSEQGRPRASGGSDGAPTAYQLRLYVAGETERSMLAVANLQRLCEEHLPGRYSIEVIDLKKHPQLARRDNIIAIPTLVRRLPEPLRRIIGDLSDPGRALVGLEVLPRSG